MKAMIFAAGLGTRLRPLTDNMPKAMVPINSKPLIYYLVKRLVEASYNDILVNVHHFPDMIISYTELLAKEFNVNIEISDERDLLRDTGGGLKYAAAKLLQSQTNMQPDTDKANEHILLHNVDILSNINFEDLAKNTPSNAISTLVVSERKTERYLVFNEENRLMGWTNISTGEIRSPHKNLDLASSRLLAFSGIHNISKALLKDLEEQQLPEKFSIMDYYIKNCDRLAIYAYVPENFKLMDVGKLSTIEQAEDFLKSCL